MLPLVFLLLRNEIAPGSTDGDVLDARIKKYGLEAVEESRRTGAEEAPSTAVGGDENSSQEDASYAGSDSDN